MGRKKINVVPGSRFGRWTIIAEKSDSGSKRMIDCRCDCGTERAVWLHSLRFGASRSCGCLQREVVRARNTTHGEAHTRTYESWKNMRRRCLDKRNVAYKHYGGRGITVCARWARYENFLADMGPMPEKAVIDRIDNDKGYHPQNCRWVSWLQSGRNKRNHRYLTARGETLPLWRWVELSGLTSATIIKRLTRGWTEEDAVTRPSMR